MQIITSLSDIPSTPLPIALTIGVFDGIHLGHQEIIKTLHKFTRKIGTRAILTFSNHPADILKPETPLCLLMSFEHRLHMLKKYGIDLVIALPFTQEFAKQSYSEFLYTLHQKLPFNALVLGEGAAFGQNREGDKDHLETFEKKLNFKTHYLKKEAYHKELISSGLIRHLVQEGKLKKIKKLLGRPYSIWKCLNINNFKKENEALYSWTFEEPNLCMLPSGVYGIDFEGEKETLPALVFLQGHQDPSGSSLSITIYLEQEPPKTNWVNLSFSQYLYPEIDPILFQSTSSIIDNFSAQPSLS